MRSLLVFVALVFAVPAAAQTTVAPMDCADVTRAMQDLLRNDARMRDWPQLERYRMANADLLRAGTRVDVVFLGDSITDAWSNEQFGGFFPGKGYINRGISGQTTPQMLVRMKPDVLAFSPKVIVLLAGTNDIAGNTGPETDEDIERNIAAIAELASASGARMVARERDAGQCLPRHGREPAPDGAAPPCAHQHAEHVAEDLRRGAQARVSGLLFGHGRRQGDAARRLERRRSAPERARLCDHGAACRGGHRTGAALSRCRLCARSTDGGDVDASRYRAGSRCRVSGHVRADDVWPRGRCAVRPQRRRQRSVPLHQSRLGPRGDDGGVRGRRCFRSAPEPGRHAGPAPCAAGFRWRKVGPYIAAQFAGAFAASAVVFATYHEALNHFDGGVRQVGGALGTAGIWATYPQPFLSAFPGGFLDQIVGTALLVGVIFALADSANFAPPERLTPVLVGLVVLAIGATFGFNAGYAINPARDFGPRLFTAMAGWGSGVFTAANGWWWVPVVAPCIGGVLGGMVYDLLITNHHPPEAPVTSPPGDTAGADRGDVS